MAETRADPTAAEGRPSLTARARRRLGRRKLQLAAAAAVLGIAAFVAAGALRSDGESGGTTTVRGPAGAEATLHRPEGWTELSKAERARLPGDPLAVLRRHDGRGLVIVNAQPGRIADLGKVSRRLDRRLRKAIPDFRKVRSRRVRVKAGEALLYSYARPRKGTAHTLIVVPAGNRSYTLNAVVPAGAEQAARQVGRILFGFDA